MPWPDLLHSRERLPAVADLAEGFATLLQQLGNVTPFELAVAGGRSRLFNRVCQGIRGSFWAVI